MKTSHLETSSSNQATEVEEYSSSIQLESESTIVSSSISPQKELKFKVMEQRIKIERNQRLKLCSIEEDGIGFLWFLRERDMNKRLV